MNYPKAYASGTVKPEETVKESPNPDEVVAQQLVEDWRRSKVTVEFFSGIHKEIVALQDEAVQLAGQYHQTNNHQLIIKKLVQVETLRKVLKNHAN